MMKVFALDGHDGAGKTSLAQALAKQVGGVYARPFGGETGARLLSAGNDKRVDELVTIGRDAILKAIRPHIKDSTPVILDRGWVTVASFVADKPAFFKQWTLWCPTTLCWIDLNTTLKRLHTRLHSNSPQYQDEQAEKLCWHRHYLAIYFELAERFNLPVLRTDQHAFQPCLDKLVEQFTQHDWSALPTILNEGQ
ncbi:hypothetical protein [Alteromonas sp. ASW11-130]|uniref:hypothetical protein n=1 Tax=Alteromonas sp. ASW11-130 TaxID=3015775 RepID=UPI00224263B4|nr:hypothetical protein [Alteromonas sp. ASW11-130]MCW8091148.1 hypothetical protein [Alteromonas sp. ASW11-130]